MLHLPSLAQQAVVAQLDPYEKYCLQLASRGTLRLVDECLAEVDIDRRSLAACSRSLAQRYPAVADLTLRCHVESQEEAQGACRGALRLMQGGAPSVTALHFDGVPVNVIASVTGGCPNAQACTVHRTWTSVSRRRSDNVPVPAAVLHICSNLPQLRSLTMREQPLSDACMQPVAALPLASLDTSIYKWDVGAWAALSSMCQLTSLQLRLDGQLLPGAHVHLSSMTSLAQLAISTRDELQGTTLHEAVVYDNMLLPESLVALELHLLPAPPLPQLSHLSSLELTRGCLKDEELGRLAISCPALAELTVRELDFTEAAHVAALGRVSKLQVSGSCAASARARFAAVFPALRDLSLACHGDLEAGAAALVGASQLAMLDIGRSGYNDPYSDDALPGISMEVFDFLVVASLPGLTTLRLNAEPDHVQGLSLCTQLKHVEWVCQADDLHEGLAAAFAQFDAPAQLASADMSWVEDELESDAGELPWDVPARPLVAVADAAMVYLARASGLRKVSWGTFSGGFARMTATRLCCAAASSSIKRISFDTRGCDVDELQRLAAVLGRNRHFDVIMQ